MNDDTRSRHGRSPRLSRELIRESPKELQRLLRACKGRPEEDRVRLLLLLKQNDSLSVRDAAVQLGRSRRSASRWLDIYRQKGVEALLRAGDRGRPRRMSEHQVTVLERLMKSEVATDLQQVRQWLQRDLGLDFSKSGAWYVLRRDLRSVSRGWVTLHDAGPASTVPAIAGRDSHDLISFLNQLPTADDAVKWIPAFRDALLRLLPDVDRISVNVDVNLDFKDPRPGQTGASITQHVAEVQGARKRVRVSVSREATETPSDRLLRGAIENGFPVEQYHPPSCFDFYVGEAAYLGTLILWRERQKPPIPATTIGLLEQMRPFILFALSDLVARHRAEQPVQAALGRALESLAASADLSDQEQRIVMLQFMGHSYKEMADILNVTVDTVKKHFKQVHKKTGTRSQSELFARYFAYRVE